jgi:hypothetical protein
MPNLSPQKGSRSRNPLSRIRTSTNITNSLIIDGTDAVAVATGDTFREIGLHLFHAYGLSTPAAIKAPFRRLSSTLRTENGSQCLITIGTLHLFFLHMKTSYETIDISLVSPQFIKEFLGSFIREKAIQIIPLLREEGIQVDLPFLFLFLIDLLRMDVLLFHRIFSLYRTGMPFCQPSSAQIFD